MSFEFTCPTKIIFGEGSSKDAVSAATGLGRHILLITGKSEGKSHHAQDRFARAGVEFTAFHVEQEPTVDLVRAGVKAVRDCGAGVVVGWGGGSALDAAKAIACLSTNPGDPMDYLEVVGRGQTVAKAGLPVVAVPTTAGTGSEVTRNAVLAVPERRMKVSLRSPYVYPKFAVIDPELTYSAPAGLTASTGMDALAQVLEPFVSVRANPLADQFCRAGMEAIGRSLVRAYEHGEDTTARYEMSFGSLMGGLALTNAGLGAVHGFASVLGGMYPAAHGEICARLLAPVVEMNSSVIQLRNPENAAGLRYAEAARLILGSSTAGVKDLLKWLNELTQTLAVPRLGEMGVLREEFKLIIQCAITASSMRANPIPLETGELLEILEVAF